MIIMIIMMNDLPKDMLKLSTIQDMDNYTTEDCKKYKEAINKRVLDLKSSNIMKFLISCCDDENLTKEVSKHASRNKGLIERFDYFYITGSMMIFLVGKYEICICGNICNILIDHESVYNEGYQDLYTPCTTGELGCVECKMALIEHLNDKLAPVRVKRAELQAHPDTVRDILHRGADRARVRAAETMAQVRKAMHLA